MEMDVHKIYDIPIVIVVYVHIWNVSITVNYNWGYMLRLYVIVKKMDTFTKHMKKNHVCIVIYA